MGKKRLFRSSRNKVLFGVCGGLGEYLDEDPVLIRILFILIMVFTGIIPMLIVYLLSALVMPEK